MNGQKNTTVKKSKEIDKGTSILITDRMMVTGMTGTGKTFFTKWFIKTYLLSKIKVVIWDPLWQYQDLGKVFHQLKEINEGEIKDLKKAIVYQPLATEDNADSFDNLSGWILEHHNIFFIAEEFSYYMSANYSPPHFEALSKRGRNYGIGIMGISQRPARIDLNYIGLVNHWIIFPQDCKPDLDRLYTYLERANTHLNQDYIATMPDRHYIHYRRDRETGKPIATVMPPIKSNVKTEPVKK